MGHFIATTLSALLFRLHRTQLVRRGEEGGPVFMANFASLIDPLLAAETLRRAYGKRPVLFLSERLKHMPLIVLAAKAFPVQWYHPQKWEDKTLTALHKALAEGKPLLFFPESRPTDTGAVLPASPVAARLLAEAGQPITPLHIEGSHRSRHTREKPHLTPKQWLPRVTIHAFPPFSLSLAETVGKDQLVTLSRHITDILMETGFMSHDYRFTLFRALLRAKALFGKGHVIVEDADRKPFTYGKLITAAFALGGAIHRHLPVEEKHVGFMLPNVSAAVVAFLGLQAYGRIPAMLNFTTGVKNIRSAAATASLHHVITSRKFIKAAELQPLVEALEEEGVTPIYLEDIAASISLPQKITALLRMLLGERGYERLHWDTTLSVESERPAVILFTSGSEGIPKGVALTHENLLANIGQLLNTMDVGKEDTIFNPLPMFHTSGLTGGVILGLMCGMKIFLYPSPLHYQTIPEMIADTGASVLFATDTFLNGYGRYAESYHLHRLRLVYAGAEKLRAETRRMWLERFGKRIFEGYGVTETAPVIAFNTSLYLRDGTVGRPLPGITCHIEPVEGITEGGRLFVQGPNVMAGYILPENPQEIIAPVEGWHDTGDIAALDEEGYLRILGRAKRFAKIAGEMVSLTTVEQAISALWPEGSHAVLAQQDARKGERLVLLTTIPSPDKGALPPHFRALGLSELYLPRDIHVVEALPLLGAGKVNYPAAEALLASLNREQTDAALHIHG